MYRILDSVEMRHCDRATIDGGIPSQVLMEKAGKAVYDVAVNEMNPEKTLVVVGAGNNGGDGLITALMLHRAGYMCDIYYAGGSHSMTLETTKRYEEAEIGCVNFLSDNDFSNYTLIIDAILGTGITNTPDEETSKVIRLINESGVPVLSVDIPSGVCADNGRVYSVAVNATRTVTMQTYKRGHVLSDGVNYCGKVTVADLGISTDIIEEDVPLSIGEEDLSIIPDRKPNSHKGSYGRVLVIGSSHGMCGAAYLSALAAYRSGAGLVEIFCPEENRLALQIMLPEAIITTYEPETYSVELLDSSLSRASVVILGPGLGKSDTSIRIVKDVYSKVYSPIIIDADALNITADNMLVYPSDVPVIVTPHPMEMSRLISKSVQEISRDPIWYSQNYAEENEVICVLKFAKTIITDSKNVFINTSGNPSLAKGGSGDVLAGVIAGMLCQDMSPIGAAALGVYIHGAAGDVTKEKMGSYSPLAREVADSISEILKKK